MGWGSACRRLCICVNRSSGASAGPSRRNHWLGANLGAFVQISVLFREQILSSSLEPSKHPGITSYLAQQPDKSMRNKTLCELPSCGSGGLGVHSRAHLSGTSVPHKVHSSSS